MAKGGWITVVVPTGVVTWEKQLASSSLHVLTCKMGWRRHLSFKVDVRSDWDAALWILSTEWTHMSQELDCPGRAEHSAFQLARPCLILFLSPCSSLLLRLFQILQQGVAGEGTGTRGPSPCILFLLTDIPRFVSRYSRYRIPEGQFLVAFGLHYQLFFSCYPPKYISLCAFSLSLESYTYFAHAVEFSTVSLSLVSIVLFIPVHLSLWPWIEPLPVF